MLSQSICITVYRFVFKNTVTPLCDPDVAHFVTITRMEVKNDKISRQWQPLNVAP